MKDAINAAIELFSKSRDPQEIDIILDKASYSEMLKAAEALENEFILGYVKLLIDIENVTTFVRLREMGKHRSFFQKVFLVDGNIQLQSFISSYEENFRQLADKFRPHGFGDIFETCANLEKGVGMYSIMEKLCDNKRIEYIKDAKFLSFGIEPAFAFIVAKESEIKNLRMILTGKIAGTPENIILERLRETYV
jgi:V/A-type H+-transporting ATPase subunit C